MALIALGKFKENNSFPYRDLSADTVTKANRKLDEGSIRYLEELIEPLRQAGRNDLSASLEETLRQFRKKSKLHSFKGKARGVEKRIKDWLRDEAHQN